LGHTRPLDRVVSSPAASLDILTIALFIAGTLAIGVWIDLAQNTFLRAHASAPNSRPFAGGDLLQAVMRPWRLVRSGGLVALFALTGSSQRDPALESLRQSYLGRRRIGLALFAAAWIVWLFSHLG
jgi:hypothetical protein